MIDRLYEQRNTITAILGSSPPLTKDAFLGRCTLASKAAHGAFGDFALSATFCLQTTQWKLSAKLMLHELRKYENVVVTSNFETFANGDESSSSGGDNKDGTNDNDNDNDNNATESIKK